MVDTVKKTMTERGIMPEKSVLVALSGGADSVALLHIMQEISAEFGFLVYAAHINHGLRGASAARDAEFSETLCEKLGIKCFVNNADVRGYAKACGIGEEAAGRAIRYDFFTEIMRKYGIECTATAHHKNDNAETILMNFMRGSTVGGLCGIPYRRGKYIRPLLDVTRGEIEKYCEEHGLEYMTDETNLDTVYTRNKIRNVMIPFIREKFNPNFSETVTANAKIMSDEDDFLNESAKSAYSDAVTDGAADIEKLNSMHKAIARRVIRMMLDGVCGTADISSKTIDSVYEICRKNQTGMSCCVARGVTARCEYGKLIIGREQGDCADFSYDLKIGESVDIPELGYRIRAEYAPHREDDGAVYFGVDGAVESISVTNRRAGDLFAPTGMNGHKTLKEYMINRKIPRTERSRVGILRINGDIAWVIGHRRDRRFEFKNRGIKILIDTLCG